MPKMNDSRDHMQAETPISDEAKAIVRAALMHVPFDGWGEEALRAGAEDAGFDPDMVNIHFPGGALDAIAAHAALADDDMVAAFQALPAPPEKVHLMIRALILLRLEQASANKEAIRRALAMLAVPSNTKLSAQILYRTVDTMWRAAGQRDTDFSFYTKRATLAAVYSATMLAWIADNTGDMAATEAFLDRRLRDVSRIPKASAPLKAAMNAGQQLAGRFATIIGQQTARRER